MKILIPARRNSKGMPFKNRKLFKYTADSIPKKYRSLVHVFTDDQVIQMQALAQNFKSVSRSSASAADTATTKDMMEEFCSKIQLDDEPVLMLYLTYPQREWRDVERAVNLFQHNQLSSLLCKKQVKQSPYLMMFDVGAGKGVQVIKHDFSRRQDYRKCFEISHYISIILPSALVKLNTNLYNSETYFMDVDDVLDVDTQKDLIKMEK